MDKMEQARRLVSDWLTERYNTPAAPFTWVDGDTIVSYAGPSDWPHIAEAEASDLLDGHSLGFMTGSVYAIRVYEDEIDL